MLDEATWAPPVNLAEAHRQRRQLVASIDEIKAQLTSRRIARRLDPSVDERMYLQWRRKTVWALTNRLQELRTLNAWIREQWDEPS